MSPLTGRQTVVLGGVRTALSMQGELLLGHVQEGAGFALCREFIRRVFAPCFI
jgi:hypothetical protein